MSHQIPVIGGVRDGDIVSVPQSAGPGFVMVLEQDTKPIKGEGPQTSDYVLIEDPTAIPPRALVLAGMRWPIAAKEGAGA